MSAYIVIHKTTKEEAKEAFDYLYEELSWVYHDKVKRHYDDTLITLGNGLTISFRCGTNPDKLAGIWPSYYYTDDNGDIADMLEQGACKVNGVRLNRIEYVVQIVMFYMDMFSEIDDWLASRS